MSYACEIVKITGTNVADFVANIIVVEFMSAPWRAVATSIIPVEFRSVALHITEPIRQPALKTSICHLAFAIAIIIVAQGSHTGLITNSIT
jgi:hypothetical protein